VGSSEMGRVWHGRANEERTKAPKCSQQQRDGRPESRPLACADPTILRRSGDLKQRLQDRWILLVLIERAQLHREQRSGP
jgi:hypothetical protein